MALPRLLALPSRIALQLSRPTLRLFGCCRPANGQHFTFFPSHLFSGYHSPFILVSVPLFLFRPSSPLIVIQIGVPVDIQRQTPLDIPHLRTSTVRSVPILSITVRYGLHKFKRFPCVSSTKNSKS
ncbi:hypothetical protein FA13DRAFT_342064 [Coprinellus micaceus]|uniref:Uncharacterized protein n=1 Tax=Coprinellus micaceus TaxID=71717 RepID=A0A4Y7TDX8_COPMI|nr:hypothetical protein FA13DRAFT_342064 [Coprinellus micaceus]